MLKECVKNVGENNVSSSMNNKKLSFKQFQNSMRQAYLLGLNNWWESNLAELIADEWRKRK